ncbi:hypothetical protein BTH42_32970 [Burkholderia sp. SRS-W-2-2016]|uniref:DNA alkylation repair protein n=1 Tax=Burkholderia sp. SRS-W-2-2016 TaxID=1926878 RepID=UPI00094B0885|nr:DNA alkylation repair protein [Burkholderia sp. SRS-W-2-2016]OLL27415.1 hypothetical protein BTH42_32970 [Burkholderia sp. SRS-W-2-2016]
MSRLSADRKAALEGGTHSTRNLSECLAIDQAALARAVLPDIGLATALPDVLQRLDKQASKGISHQIAVIGMAIGIALHGMKKDVARQIAQRLSSHPSDTVRSWTAFALTRADPTFSLRDRLAAVRPFAADTHFGVREWAWIAVRPYIAAELVPAVTLLQGWTDSPDPNIRRFAVESTRPRGVWCEHIGQLKTNPGMGLPLLEALKADNARYVQDSVANWLNDASKTAPAWVVALCEQWTSTANPATDRIVERALRTVRKGGNAARPAKRSG